MTINKVSKEPAQKLQVFIAGETIDLCIPNKNPEILRTWSDWLNDPEVNTYLAQGIFPHSVISQAEYVDQHKKSDRIVLLIRPKNNDYIVGVISLSRIDMQNRNASIAHLIGFKDGKPDSIFYSLEAKAILTRHAFEKIGLKMIYCQQVLDLINWQRWQPLFGYFFEGINRYVVRYGNNYYDAIRTSCIIDDYQRIKEARGGNIWPGKDKVFELLKKTNHLKTLEELKRWLNDKYSDIRNNIE